MVSVSRREAVLRLFCSGSGPSIPQVSRSAACERLEIPPHRPSQAHLFASAQTTTCQIEKCDLFDGHLYASSLFLLFLRTASNLRTRATSLFDQSLIRNLPPRQSAGTESFSSGLAFVGWVVGVSTAWRLGLCCSASMGLYTRR